MPLGMGSYPVPVPAQMELGTPTGGVYGSSPRTRENTRDCTPTNHALAARKFFKRLQYDPSLEAAQFSVGILETREQAERKSGAEAWSLRLHSSLIELGFTDVVARFEKEGEEIPFHRIVWYKQNGVIVWEAEHLKAKLIGGECNHHGHSHHHGHPSQLPPAPVPLSCSFTGCSPPAGSFMARLTAGAAGVAAAAAAASSTSAPLPAGLPPRSASLTPEYSASSSHSAHSQQVPWKPQRHSATDCSGSPCSWGGPGHWSAAAAAGGGLDGSACNGQSPAGHSPLLGTSPFGCCALSAGHSSASYPYGNSPKTLAGNWTAAAGSFATANATDSAILGGSLQKSHATPSPCGSCSSSYTATSALAAAMAAGGPALALARPSTAGTCTSAVSTATTGPWPLGTVELTDDAAGEGVIRELQQAGDAEEEVVLADYSMLPEECWVNIMQRLGVKELCYVSRVSRSLRCLASRSFLWSSAYERLFAAPPPADWSGQTVKRLCRRSELRASRWVEAEVEGRSCGFSGTWCCQLDDAKVVSGDGCCVRLWSHDSGRRIATLRGHTGRVTAVAFDEELIVSGCSQGTVKLWSMDELKLSKTLRHHTDAVTATALLHGLPISASKDGTVCVWDAAAPNSPLVVLEHGAPVHALQLQEDKGQLISSNNSLSVWDMNTAQLLYKLNAPASVTHLSSSGASSSSLSTTGGGAAAGPAVHGSSAAGAGAAVEAVLGGGADALDADDADGDLLHDGWLLDDDDDGVNGSSSEDGDVADAAGAAAAGGGGGGGRTSADFKPFTCVSCSGNVVAAGRAGSVVLWDLRSQDPVGLIKPSAAFGNSKPSNSPCVGVQLDDWKLVTGWAGAGGCSGGGSSSSCWWRSSSDITDLPVGNSLEVYDIRSASSLSSVDIGASSSSSSSSAVAAAAAAGGGGVWSAAPVMSLPVLNRVTCFQFYGQKLLVGQEGADCCLISFNPPGSSTARAAAAWGFGGAGNYSAYGSVGAAACYGMSPGAHGVGYAGYEDGGSTSEGGGGRGNKGRKKGAAKVPAKKQTRYPKRTTR